MDFKRILLVEDNPYDAELALETFDVINLANKVVHVKDGVEALEYLHLRGEYSNRTGGNPILVLLDLKLPRVDGIQVLKAIRSDSLLKTIPVVVLTSSREDKDVMESYGLGVNAYVVKPVDFPSFTRAVTTIGIFWALFNEPPRGSAL